MATKGTAMLAAVKALRKLEKEEVLALLDPPLHKYLEERVLVTEWYPTQDVVALLRALAALTRKYLPDLQEDVYRFMGRMVALTDLTGVYSLLLKPGDPVRTLRAALVQWRAYWDNGRLELEILRPNRARMELSDFELPCVEECGVRNGWYSECLSMAGAQEVKVVETRCRCRGDPTCVWEMEWK